MIFRNKKMEISELDSHIFVDGVCIFWRGLVELFVSVAFCSFVALCNAERFHDIY